MFGLDTAVMRPLDPSSQIAENQMNHGQVRLCLARKPAERQRLMAISSLGKAGIAGPAIGAQRRAKRDVLFDKAGKRVGATVGDNAKPQPSGIDSASVFLALIFKGSNLDTPNYNGLWR